MVGRQEKRGKGMRWERDDKRYTTKGRGGMDGGGEGETAEKEVVYYRYLCEPNLYCIKISG